MPRNDDEPQHLKPWKPFQWIWRTVLELDYQGSTLHLDADFFDFMEHIHLYRDGVKVGHKSSPAKIPLDDGATAHAEMSWYGLKYAYLEVDGEAEPRRFQPIEGTAEAWRARLDRDHPTLSRVIGMVSWTILFFALIVSIPPVINLIGEWFDFSVPTVPVPSWLQGAMPILGVIAGLERALRFRYNSWLDD